MPIVAKQIDAGSTLEQIRQQFNNLQSDVETLQASPTYGTAIIFEGTTNDDFETSLTAQDPTADRTIYLPNLSGYLLTDESAIKSTTSEITANNSTNETVYITFVDGATGEQGLESDTGLTYNPSTNALNLGSIVISNGSTIGSASDQDAITISSAGLVTLSAAAALSVTGTSTFNEDVTFTGASYNAVWDKSDNALEFADSARLIFGAGADLTIYHDGSNSYVTETSDGTGNLYILGTNITIGDQGNTHTYFSGTSGGASTLYHDNNQKLATSAAGVSITGTATMSGNVVIADAGTIGSASDTDALAIDASGNVTASQNVTITGNLTVNGTTTTVSTSNTVIGDSLIELNSGAGSNTNDLGIVMERGSTGDNAIIAWDESADKFVFGTTTATGASTGNLTIANGTIVAANIEGTLSTAAQTNITSLGTLTALTVDNVVIDGAVIGHTGDTDLMTLAAGVLTVAGRVDASDDIYLTGDEKKVRWYNGSNYVTLGANSSLSSNLAFTLPTADGSSGQALVTDGSGNFSFASNNVGNATSFTVTANNSTDETVYPVFVDGATGEQNAETDTGLTYNPSTGLLSTAGITLTGALTVAGTTTLNGALVLGDAAADALTINATTTVNENMTFTDGDKAIFGTGSDLQIYHDGSNSYIDDASGTGNLTFRTNQANFISAGGDTMLQVNEDGAVSLYYDNTVQLATGNGGGTLTGIWNVTGSLIPDAADGATLGSASYEWSDLYLADSATIQFGNDQEIILTHVPDSGIRLHDSDKFMFGDGNDLQIYHDGTNSWIRDLATAGNFIIEAVNGIDFRDYNTGELMTRMAGDGAVTLYHDNSAKLATNSGGITVTGNVVPASADGGALGGTSAEWSDLLLADGAIVYLGNDQDVTLTHDADVGVALNAGSTIYRGAAGQYDAGFTVREGVQSDAHFEWGHSNTSGYGCTIGATNGGGTPFIGFFNGPGTNSNTFRTHGIRGNGFYAASGAIYVYDITTADADNQSVTNRITLDTTAGNITTSGTVTATAGATLLIKNSSGSTLKTIKGMS